MTAPAATTSLPDEVWYAFFYAEDTVSVLAERVYRARIEAVGIDKVGVAELEAMLHDLAEGLDQLFCVLREQEGAEGEVQP